MAASANPCLISSQEAERPENRGIGLARYRLGTTKSYWARVQLAFSDPGIDYIAPSVSIHIAMTDPN